ncbi:hypothetical protein [Streptomyces sp. NPDC087300]|uniref:hypothetical protein n=1 Tax=Streptomyces sp. NPDC087300 TaxID=3365780 RepID=UPI003827AC9D
MSRRRALAALTLVTLTLSPVATARADVDTDTATDTAGTQSCRITGYTADQGRYVSVTSIPHPVTAQRCRDLGGTVTSNLLDATVTPSAEEIAPTVEPGTDVLDDVAVPQSADILTAP